MQEMLPRLMAGSDLTRAEALVAEMIETCLRLLRDQTTLADVKLLNAAIRELRYAFTVFAPYRGVRKISIFGSARTAQDAPAAVAAREFARRVIDSYFR